MPEEIGSPNVKYKRRIFTKGVLLVLVPLLCEILLLLLVNHSSHEADRALEDQRAELEQTIHANRLLSAGTVGYGYYCRYLISRDEKAREKGEHFVQIALSEFKLLLKLAGDDPERQHAARDVYELAVPEMEKLKWLRPWIPGESVEEPFRQLRSARTLVFSAYENYQKFYQISNVEHERLNVSMQKERNSRERVKQLVTWGMVANFLVSLGLVIWFGREISERMNILVENATKLPRRVELLDEIEGNDEFWYLDKILHKASDQLNQAAQFRKHLMEMVAHDMRSPLSAVSLSLAVLEKADGDKIDETARPLLKSGTDLVEKLIALVNDLLTIEKLAVNVTEVTAVGMDSFDQDTHAGVHELTQLMKLELGGQTLERIEQEKKFRPGIFKKGLLLVLVPLAFGTILLGWISTSINSSDAALDAEHKQTEIATGVNRMMSMGVVSYGFLGNYLLYGKSHDHSMGMRFRNLADREWSKLVVLVKGDVELEKLLKRLKKVSEVEWERFTAMRPYMSQDNIQDEMELYNSVMPFWKFAIYRQEEFLKLSEAEQARLAAARNMQAVQHRSIDNIVIGGIAGSIALSLILVFLFSRNISTRLAVLTYNSTKLPIREPLAPQVAGTDEIAYLDFVLHDVAEQLDKVWKQRTTIMKMVARDLREPLLLIQATLRALQAEVGPQLSEMGTRQISSARANVDRMLGLVDDLLTIENLESGKIELSRSVFDITQAVDESINSVQALAVQRKVTLVNETKSMTLNADRERIVQVLVNYLSNAISHSPQNTTVSVTSMPTPSAVEIHVNDMGPGLADDLKAKVFDRFFQAPDSQTRGKGHGLGLAICQMIIDGHGGQVGVVDADSGGCSFWLRLPVGTITT